MKVPAVREGLDISLQKCKVDYTEDECLETGLTLPRQACPRKVGRSHVETCSLHNIALDDEYQERVRVCGRNWIRGFGIRLYDNGDTTMGITLFIIYNI